MTPTLDPMRRRSLPPASHARTWRPAAALTALALLAGCSDDGSDERKSETSSPIPLECQGFAMDGLRHSPGGTALPNTCKPFDVLTNNPFAVRCVDALPGYQTRYPGDEYCILPPAPDQGVQVGVHPQGTSYWERMWAGDYSDYGNDAITRPFELGPGLEIEQVFLTRSTNEEEEAFYRIDSRMRTGSHHMATHRTSLTDEDGWREVSPSAIPVDADGGFFWNSQRSNADRPSTTLDVAPENEGIGSPLPARQGILFDLHHFNTDDEPILREAWINVWWVEGEATRSVVDVPIVAPVDVEPGTVEELVGTFTATGRTRVLSLFGHRHAWTTRVHGSVTRAGGAEEPVYDSFDWLDVPTFSYDSVSDNPAPDEAARKDGASSGILTLEPGDELSVRCRVEATAERAAHLGVPVPDEPLVFGNEAFGAEMCILYSQTTPAGP